MLTRFIQGAIGSQQLDSQTTMEAKLFCPHNLHAAIQTLPGSSEQSKGSREICFGVTQLSYLTPELEYRYQDPPKGA